MKIKIILLLILSVLLIQNCAPKKRLQIASIASSYQKKSPEGELISEKKHMVSLSHYTEIKTAQGKTMFRMIIENRGNKPVKIGSKNISVIFKWQNKEGASKEIRIQTLDLFMNELEIGHYIREYGMIAGTLGGMQVALMDMLSSPGGGGSGGAKDENPKGVYGVLDRMGKTLVELADGTEVTENTKVKESIKEMRAEFAQHKESLPLIFLRSQTIMPGEVYLGIVACDTRFMQPQTEGNLKVTVSIDSENHEFSFKRSFTNIKKGKHKAPVYSFNLPQKARDQFLGEWNGQIKTQGSTLTAVFRFETTKDGEFIGFLDSPDQGEYGIPISKIKIVDGKVNIKISQLGAKYKGKMEGDKIVGKYTQKGGSFPLTLKKGEYKAAYNFNIPEKTMDQLLGEWNGKLGPMAVVFRFETKENGDFTGYVDSPMQGAYGMPITGASLTDGKLKLKVKTVNGEFNGQLSGNSLTGDWTQMGKTNPLTLKKKNQ